MAQSHILQTHPGLGLGKVLIDKTVSYQHIFSELWVICLLWEVAELYPALSSQVCQRFGAGTKIPDIYNLKEEGFILVQGFSLWSAGSTSEVKVEGPGGGKLLTSLEPESSENRKEPEKGRKRQGQDIAFRGHTPVTCFLHLGHLLRACLALNSSVN